MKNIQVIDGALNCTYDVFAADDDDFYEIFPCGQDIEFIEDFFDRVGDERASSIMKKLWRNRQDKKTLNGIHGTLFYGLKEDKEVFYPDKTEANMVNGFPK